jgi:hypothetical protein
VVSLFLIAKRSSRRASLRRLETFSGKSAKDPYYEEGVVKVMRGLVCWLADDE